MPGPLDDRQYWPGVGYQPPSLLQRRTPSLPVGYGGASVLPSGAYGPSNIQPPGLVTNAPIPPSRSAVMGDPGAPQPGAAATVGAAPGSGPLGFLASLFAGGQGQGQGISGLLAQRNSGAGRI